MPQKPKPTRKPTKPSKPAKPAKTRAPAPAKRTPKPAPTPPAPPSRMARALAKAEHDPDQRPPLQPRAEPGEQLGLPDIDQVRDAEMERHYAALVDAKAARKAAQDRIHEVEAAIQVRFDQFAEADPDDPRALVYIVANGAPLKPTTTRKISCGRPPAKPKKALEDAQRQAAEEPNLPDPDGDE